jgi:hypothetical protein
MHGISWIPSSVLTLVLGVALAVPAKAAMPDAWITIPWPMRRSGASLRRNSPVQRMA